MTDFISKQHKTFWSKQIEWVSGWRLCVSAFLSSSHHLLSGSVFFWFPVINTYLRWGSETMSALWFYFTASQRWSPVHTFEAPLIPTEATLRESWAFSSSGWRLPSHPFLCRWYSFIICHVWFIHCKLSEHLNHVGEVLSNLGPAPDVFKVPFRMCGQGMLSLGVCWREPQVCWVSFLSFSLKQEAWKLLRLLKVTERYLG